MSDVVYERAVDDYYAEFLGLLHGMVLPADEPEPEPKRKRQLHRRITPAGITAGGTSVYRIYSLTRPGREIRYEVRVNFEDGTFSCTCPHHEFRGATCKHIKRACATERRRRERDVEI